MSRNKNRPLHIAMYPWFALGHLTSFLHLANKLAERGHKISFLLPTKTQSKLVSYNHHPDTITFIPITLPPVDGLPLGAETTNDVPFKASPLIMTAMDMTRDTIEAHLSLLKPDFIFYDFTHWLPKLARKHGVKPIYYSTIHLVIFAYTSPQARDLPMHHRLTDADLVSPPTGFPNPAIKLQAHEARAMAGGCTMEFGGGLTFTERHSIGVEESDAIGVKTCKEIEGGYCDFVEKHFGKPVLLAGPILPEPPSSTLDDRLDGWLEGFSHDSVVHCAFGSECVLEKNQFQELLLGLELTGRPFLAALKPPAGYKTIELALPEGFAKRTKDRGMVHDGWVNQQAILHHPSVGCFVTHCGAGSLSEAMVSGCQLVMIPQAMDQFINARLMRLELRVGVEVQKGENDGFFTKEAVCKAVSMVMDEESEVGREVRSNHTKWREFLLRDGLEESYINSFIQSLQELLG